MAAAPPPKKKKAEAVAKEVNPPTPGELLDTGILKLGEGLGQGVNLAGDIGSGALKAGKEAISDAFYLPSTVWGSAPITDTLYKLRAGYEKARPPKAQVAAPDLQTAAPPAAAQKGVASLSANVPEQPSGEMALRLASAPPTSAPSVGSPMRSPAPMSGVDVLSMLQAAAPAAAAPAPAGPDPIAELIAQRQKSIQDQLAAATAAAAPKKPTMFDAIGKLAAGLAPLAVGAIAGKASGLGAGSGLGIGAGVGSEALRRIEAEEQGRSKEDREAAKENLRFARQAAQASDDEALRYAIGEKQHARGVQEDIAKEGRMFKYDQLKMKAEDAYKRGQISLSQSMEIEKELLKKQMESQVQMGEDQDYNALVAKFGGDKEALKQGREDLERERLFDAATGKGGTFDKIKEKITELESHTRVPGAGKFAQATGVGRYAREAEEINASMMNIANTIMSSKGGDARYSPEKMKQLIKPFLYNTGVGLKENIGNVDQMIETIRAIKGESSLLKSAGIHVGQNIMTAQDAAQLSDQQLAQARAKGWRIKDVDGTIY